MIRVGFLGAGKMAQALAIGFLKAKFVKSDDIIASCVPQDTSCVDVFKNLGSRITFENKEVVKNVNILILAVKPDVVSAVLKDIRDYVTENVLLISIAMGITLQILENNLPKKSKIIRVMPNTPCLVQHGVSVFVPGSFVGDEDLKLTRQLLKSVGTCDQVPEYLLDVVTALSGSGPAYIFVIIEALADGAVRMGMPRDLAYRLAAQTVLGAAKMVLNTGQHPANLKDNVSSPGGSTMEGLFAMETSGVRAALIKTLEVATKKCKETSSSIK